jgi:hydroxymethylbilane synthase
MELVIGSRGSKLALWQAEWVASQFALFAPDVEARIEIIKTSGDVIQDVPLSVIGGKGVFTKELEHALLEGRIDVAVHSLKDLPTIMPDGLTIAAITEREDPRDALVLRSDLALDSPSLKGLPFGACVGTSSQRRLAQLKRLRPDITVKDLRGNVDTRLRKLDAGWYDAVILASAGLRRLGFESRISAPISTEEMLPAVGQGALGIETRAADAATVALVARLEHAATRMACVAERAFLRGLGGGCQVPIAGHAVVRDGSLKLEGLVAALSGEKIIRGSLEADTSRAEALGDELAALLREQGADALLSASPT